MIGGFPNEVAASQVISTVLGEERLKWGSIGVEPEHDAQIEQAVTSLDEEPIWTELTEALAVQELDKRWLKG